MKRAGAVVASIAASTLLLAGCAGGGADTTDDGRITVVASTNVYGQIAEAIGGDAVAVTSIIEKASQDPHSFEASARDQLTVSRADLIIENGGGYDAFMDHLIDASGTGAPVLTAVEFSAEWPGDIAHDDSEDHDHADHDHDHADHGHVDGFNEHVWYDLTAMSDLAADIASELAVLSPDDRELFSDNLAAFQSGVAGLEADLALLASEHSGHTAFLTEPIAAYLAAAAGLTDVTPPAFSRAVEAGQDVPPATLVEALRLVPTVAVVIANAQTGGAETARIIDEAQAHDVPVVEFTETLPSGTTYLEWMAQNIAALQSALQ